MPLRVDNVFLSGPRVMACCSMWIPGVPALNFRGKRVAIRQGFLVVKLDVFAAKRLPWSGTAKRPLRKRTPQAKTVVRAEPEQR